MFSFFNYDPLMTAMRNKLPLLTEIQVDLIPIFTIGFDKTTYVVMDTLSEQAYNYTSPVWICVLSIYVFF